jgi:hypothetical protein
MTDKEIIDLLRASLCNGEKGKAIRLDFKYGGQYFNTEFVKSCIDYLEKKIRIITISEDVASPLETLAITLLLDSAGIDIPKEQLVGVNYAQNKSK